MSPESEFEPSVSPADIAARGGWYAEFTTRPSAPAIWQTTAFDLQGLEHLDAVASGAETGYIYTRDGNPNHEAFAADMARMEGAEFGFVAASGMGALTAVFMAHLQSGDHVVASQVLYGRTYQLINHLRDAFGVEVSYVDGNKPSEFAAAVGERTRICVVESISNPLMEVTDIAAVKAAIGDVPLLVDSTFATPCLLRPIEHGADLVFHSASKYLNGHGDVMLGVLVGSNTAIRRSRALSSLFGVNSNPFECWLASRGLRTLPLRMDRVSRTAMRVAEFLAARTDVAEVFYPGLPQHPSRSVAERLLPNGYGGMLAFDLPGGRDAVSAVFRRLSRYIPFSPTLADARTTVSYPAGTSHKFMSPSERKRVGIGDGLIRLSIGLEEPETLCSELGHALDDVSRHGST